MKMDKKANMTLISQGNDNELSEHLRTQNSQHHVQPAMKIQFS
jgi:hypothetical protein